MKLKVKNKNAKGSNRGKHNKIRPEKRRKAIFIVVLVIMLALLVAAGVTALVLSNEINGKRTGEALDVVVTVPEGGSTGDVAQALKDAGLITSRSVFKIYCRMNDADGKFQFGEKTLNKSMSYDAMIAELQKVTIKEIETFSLTIPEGKTALSIAIMLEELGVCTRQEFVEVCNTDTFEVGFWNDISKDENKFVRLEGYLFPDTYQFEVGSSLHDMIQKMLENFETKVLTPDRKVKIASSGHTLEEIITLSSIVEKESVGEDSYAMVAGVFYNRLNSPDKFPCLESDTSCDWRKRDLKEQEDYYGGYFPGVLQYYYGGYENVPQGTLDGYDTFSHKGLIIGAICNPGLIAIDGTLEPTKSDYFFFFTGEDKKTFYWSKTAEEHAKQYEQYGPA
ncbi:MAG: endolytic transglycosylase MltG [Oscillospiraceae bacterium]